MDFYDKTALETGALIKSGKISSPEVTKAYIEKIKSADKEINSFVTVLEEDALKQAEEVQAKIDKGELNSPLAGVPVAIKDNICTKDILTTCSSKMLYNFKPPYNACVVEKLKAQGAVIVGKTNLDEFAMGGSTETSYYGVTKNPFNTNRVSGGSSGGSAAAVAAGLVPYALGSDTGGSIRQPCSFCGVSGIKPTYGGVSRYGLVAFASSLDQIGPIGKDIKDCAEILKAVSGHDERDSTSIKDFSYDFSESFGGDLKGMKIGVPTNYFGEGLDSEVRAAVLTACVKLKELGAEVIEFEMPIVDYAIPAYYIIACAEASSNLSRYDGIKYGYRSEKGESLLDVFFNSRSEGFGMEVKRRIMLGSFVLSSGYFDAYYKKGLQVRGLIKKSFNEAFEKCDMILSPVAPTTAYRIGENVSDPLKMYLGDIYTVSVNLAGIPAVSLPCGFDSDGLPIGMQLIGQSFSEAKLVKAGYAYQQATEYHKKTFEAMKGGRF
ncbi:MAG: Asp-tRNA(Asn)/Glu-tRNA(Gln) amidotransferase subunit GatA [Clostridiales bacterium]|nr:Asp-tRNA(Asn)/Glu-tRNA(Gln) amidotransferase subunit GatA [Clostridiales bacterium]